LRRRFAENDIHSYAVRPHKDGRGFELISDALHFGPAVGPVKGTTEVAVTTRRTDLPSFRLFPILAASHLPRPRNIDEAYLICSYEPKLGNSPNPYPVHKG
jgi:hypothetical protein